MGKLIQDAQWIKLESIRSALQICFENHGHVCGFPLGVSAGRLPMLTYLIDFEDQCIVEASSMEQIFLLLSYLRPARASVGRFGRLDPEIYSGLGRCNA